MTNAVIADGGPGRAPPRLALSLPRSFVALVGLWVRHQRRAGNVQAGMPRRAAVSAAAR
jgi:hypothetical protein